MTTPPLTSHSSLISPSSSSSQRKWISTVVAPCFPFSVPSLLETNSKPVVSTAQSLRENDKKNCQKVSHVSLFSSSSKSDSSSSSSTAQVLYALQSSPFLPRTSLDISGGDRRGGGEDREVEDDFKYQQQMKEEGDEGKKRCNSLNSSGNNSQRYLRRMQRCLYPSATFASSSSFSEKFEYPVSFHRSDSAVSSSSSLSSSSSCCYMSSSSASSLGGGGGTARVQQSSPIVRRSIEGRKGHVGLCRQPAISEEVFVPEQQEEEKDEEEGKERNGMMAMMAIVGETEILEGGKDVEEINRKEAAWRVVGKSDDYMTSCGRINKCDVSEESGIQGRREVDDGFAYFVIDNNEQPESEKDKMESRRIQDVVEENQTRKNSEVFDFSGGHFQRCISFDQDDGKEEIHPRPLEYKKSISPTRRRRRRENENETREFKTGEEQPLNSRCTDNPRLHPIHRSSTESFIDASSDETPGVHFSDCPLDSISSTPHPSPPFSSSPSSVAIPSASGTAGCIVASGGSLAASFVPPAGNDPTTPAVSSPITPPSPNVNRTDDKYLDVVPISSCLRPLSAAEQKRDCTYTAENHLQQQWHSAKQSRSRVSGKNGEKLFSNTEDRCDDSRLHDYHDSHPSQPNPYYSSSVSSCSESLNGLSHFCEVRRPPSSLAVLLCQIVVTRDELLHLLKHVPVEVLMADSEEAQSLFVLDPYSSSAAFDMTSAEEAVAVLPLPKLEFIMKSMLIYLCRDYLILLSNTIAIRVVVSRSVISSLSTEDAKDKNWNSSLPSSPSSSSNNSRVKDSSSNNNQRIEEDEVSVRTVNFSASPSSTFTGTPHSSNIFSSSTSSSNLISSSTSPLPAAAANYIVGTLAHEDEDKLYTVALCEGLVSGAPYQLDASWRDHIRSEGLVERHVQLGLTMRLFAVTPGNVAVKVPFNGVSNRRLGWEELQTICSPRSSQETPCCDSVDESCFPTGHMRIKMSETVGSSDCEKKELEKQQTEKKSISSIVVNPAAVCSSTKASLSSSLTTTITREEKISLSNAVEAIDDSRIEERIMEALVMHAYEDADESTHRKKEPEEMTIKREVRKVINEGMEKRREEEEDERVNSSKEKERRDFIFFPFEFTLFETDEKKVEQQEASPQVGEAKSLENVEEVPNMSGSIIEPHRFQEDEFFVHPHLPPVMAAAAAASAGTAGCRPLASYDAAMMQQLLSSSSMIAHPYLPLRTINSDYFSSCTFPPSSDESYHISVFPKELHSLYQRRLSSPSIVSQKLPLNSPLFEAQCISAASSSSVSHTSLTSPVVHDFSCSSSSSLSHNTSSSPLNARNTPLTANTHERSCQGSFQNATVSSSTYSLPFSVKDLEKRAASLFCLRHFADNLCSLQRILPSLREADEENEIPFGGPGLRIRDFIRESLRSLQAALFEVVFIYKRDDLQDLVEELKDMMEKTP